MGLVTVVNMALSTSRGLGYGGQTHTVPGFGHGGQDGPASPWVSPWWSRWPCYPPGFGHGGQDASCYPHGFAHGGQHDPV